MKMGSKVLAVKIGFRKLEIKRTGMFPTNKSQSFEGTWDAGGFKHFYDEERFESALG